MQRFLPTVGVEPLDELYVDLGLPERHDRPHVFLGMVSSVDGAATVNGRSGPLGAEADRQAYRRLREHADAILVGAGTVRAEDYGPPVRRAVEARRRRGQAEVPTIVVVTASAALDPTARLFADPSRRPLIITVEDAPDARVTALRAVADVVTAGVTTVDPAVALAHLHARGHRWVLCEGGPQLNGTLVAAGLADELFLTLAPAIAGSTRHRIVEGRLPSGPRPLTLAELRHHEGELLLRYRFGQARSGTG